MIQIKAAMAQIILFSLLLLVNPSSMAEMYKWVDEDGNINYSAQKPPDVEDVETIKASSKGDTEKALMRLRDIKIYNDKYKKERQKRAADQRLAEEARVRKENNCRKGKARLASFSSRPRVQLVQEDGSRVRATDEQRQAQIDEAKQMIEEFCN